MREDYSMPNLTENEWVPGDLPGAADEQAPGDAPQTPDYPEATSDGMPPAPAAVSSRADDPLDPGLVVVTELDATEADPLVLAEMRAVVAEDGALVEPTSEAEAAGRAAAADDPVEVDMTPLFLGDAYLPGAGSEVEAKAIAVEAALQADEMATDNAPGRLPPERDGAVVMSDAEPGLLAVEATRPEPAPSPVDAAAPADQAALPAAEAEPAKAKRRAKKALTVRPALGATAVEAADALSVASIAPAEPPRGISSLPDSEPLSLVALVESLLFVADGAVPVARLAEALEIHLREVEAALSALAESYRHRGLSLQRFRDRVQLTTAPAAAALVERFLGLAASTPLSRAALEALAIVAYQQPVTRPQIEAVRGVNSDSVIKNLLTKGLIEESGRAEGPGRPVLYSTTTEFMQHFGLTTLTDLPPLTPPTADTPSDTISELLKG